MIKAILDTMHIDKNTNDQVINDKKYNYQQELEEYKKNLNNDSIKPNMFNLNMPENINEIEPKIMKKTDISSIKLPKEISGIQRQIRRMQ